MDLKGSINNNKTLIIISTNEKKATQSLFSERKKI